ncbi:MAG: ABC transporter substrate-binding protein [Cyanophyceae cyanobacterium]|jgi:ABC-type Fe3+ transport system substrate-binding protein
MKVFRLTAAFLVSALASAAAIPSVGQAQEQTLVLYTNDFEDIIGDRFTADTGIEITVVQESGGNLLARIAAERGNPQWDVLLFDGVGSLHSLDQDGQLLQGFEPENLSNMASWALDILPESRGYFPAGASSSCLLTYRTDLVDNPPQTFFDLTDESYRGLVGSADPAVAAPAYPCVAWLHYEYGVEEAREFYQGLIDNELQVFRTNGPARRALEAGDISIALLSSPPAYALLNSETPVEVIWPAEGAPSSSRGVAIQASTSQQEAAQTFIEWMLEPETQQFLTDNAGIDGWFRASVEGVTPLAGGPAEDAVYNIAPAAFASDNEAEIKNWFADQAVE